MNYHNRRMATTSGMLMPQNMGIADASLQPAPFAARPYDDLTKVAQPGSKLSRRREESSLQAEARLPTRPAQGICRKPLKQHRLTGVRMTRLQGEPWKFCLQISLPAANSLNCSPAAHIDAIVNRTAIIAM
jgi:hypothetical protein